MVKAILKTILLIFTTISLRAQVSLENSYSVTGSNNRCGLTVVKLDVSGDKYLFYNTDSNIVTLYNLDHSVFKTFMIPTLPTYPQNSDHRPYIGYFSENLFNSDSKLEYVAWTSYYTQGMEIDSYSKGSTRVYNENGNVVFDGDSLLPTFKTFAQNFGTDSYDFIFNTSNGAKMILFSYKSNLYTQNVYSLPGTLLSSINRYESKDYLKLPFPNPTASKIEIPYKLENGSRGKLVINDLNGKILLEYNIDNNFENFILDSSSLTGGNYYYSIYSNDMKMSVGKFVVVK